MPKPTFTFRPSIEADMFTVQRWCRRRRIPFNRLMNATLYGLACQIAVAKEEQKYLILNIKIPKPTKIKLNGHSLTRTTSVS